MKLKRWQERFYLGVIAAVVLLLINAGLSAYHLRVLNDNAYWVAHTQEVMAAQDDVLSTVVDSETTSRGYVITGEQAFLQPVDRAEATGRELARLKQLTADNPQQQAEIAKLEQHIAARLDELGRINRLRSAQGFDAARELMLEGRGKLEMDAVREIVTRMEAEELELLPARQAQSRKSYQVALLGQAIGAAVGIALMLLALFVYRRGRSARERADTTLKASEERFRALITATSQIVWTSRPDGAALDDSPSWRAHTGQTYAEWKGFGWRDAFHPDDKARVAAAWKETVRLKQPIEIDYRLRRADGSYTWTTARAAPVFGAAGEIREWVGTNTDISARKAAEQRLRDSEARFRAVAEALPQAVYTTRADGVRDYVNRYWHDYTGEQDFSTWQSFVHPEDVDGVLAEWQASISTGEPFDSHYRYRRADGVYLWHLSRAVPLRDDGGKIIQWVGTSIDIDETIMAQHALEEAARHKDEFLAMLAHELRNPLAPIRNAVHVLQLIGPQEPRQQKARNMIVRQVEHLTRLIDDLLDVSRITKGKVALRKEPLELAAIVHGALDLVRPLIEARGHQLRVCLPAEPLRFEGDRTRLIQAIGNLLGNAAKYTGEGGCVSVEGTREGDELVLRVRDNGIGIPAHLLPRVFDLFTQAERSVDRGQGGLGIGLYLVRMLAEMHGGSIEGLSEGVGKGSEFVLRLPLMETARNQPLQAEAPSEEAPQPLPAEAAMARQSTAAAAELPAPVSASATAPVATALTTPMLPAATAQAGSLRTLIVDDNADAADSLGLLLQLSGHPVKIAHEGEAALSIARQFEPEVLLLDIGLPGMDGYELARRLRGVSATRDAVFIAMTGYGQEEDRQRSRAAGYDYHLVKPVDPEALNRLIARLVQQRRMAV